MRYVIRPTPEGADYYNVLTDGDAHGDGSTTDTQHILDAVTAYKAAGKDGLYFPDAEYLLSTTLVVPDDTVLVGESMTGAWLQGPVQFGSTSSFADLKIGPNAVDIGPSIRNVDGADGTSFTRCHFRGGGTAGAPSSPWQPNVYLGYHNDVSNVTFTDCEIERCLGGDNYTNVVAIYTLSDNTISGITFDGCHFGVSNGTLTGSGAMMVEAWTAPYGLGWEDLTFTGCEFEVSDSWCVDLCCFPNSVRATGALIEDCLFHGSVSNMAINLECPLDVTITGNHFHRHRGGGVYTADTEVISNDTQYQITNNTFDWDTAENSITVSDPPLWICTSNNVITGNTFIYHGGHFAYELPAVDLHNTTAEPDTYGGQAIYGVAEGNTVTGNTFDLGVANSVGERNGATDNTMTPNTFV